MKLSAGSRLGAYEIVGAIGSGGMGDVYRARDTRLGREVALKFLPDDLALDPDRRARFDREARALAALNHPGIVSIYAIETEGGQPFIAMECVEGRVLTDVIPKDGLPLDRLLAIATQVAGAVAAAHTHGIVHRDLKPANVMVGPRDVVKVLDFGLAKALGANASRATAETVAVAVAVAVAPDTTGEGRILGTVAYMSPEQAEGRAVDTRSDIFSLGVLFYEMAVGERPFKGDTSLSVLSAILRDTPRPLLDVNPSLPRELARVVRRCLAKDPDDRYQSAADLRSDLDDLRQASHAGELRLPASIPVSSKTPSKRWTLAAGLSVAALSGLAGVAWRGFSPAVVPSAPRMTFSRLTLLDGVAQQPMISPDGKWVVYVSNVSGNPDIYLQSTTGQTAINLTKDSPAADTTPAFSADGERIAFRSERDGGGLFVMGRTGESVRRLTKSGIQPAWFPDGRRLAFVSAEGQSSTAESRGGGISELWTVDTTGGEPQRIYRGDAVQPRVSPNGRRIAFWAMQPNEDFTGFANPNRDVWTVSVDGTDPVRVTTGEAIDWNPVWSPDGSALHFLSNRSGSMNLWRVGIDEATGATAGEAQALTAPASYVRDFSLSADGRLGTYANWATTSNLARIRIDTREAATRGPIEAITTGPRDFITFDVNRDGQVVLRTSVTQQEDLLIATTGSDLRYLLNDRYRDRNPRWTTDGRQIFFYSDRGQDYELYSIDRDGGGLRQLTETGGKRFYPVPSRDGSKVLAADITSYELFVYDAKDFSKAPDRLPPLPPELRGPNFIPLDWSPDGRSLSGASGPNIWVYAFETRTYRRVGTHTVGGLTAQWFPDGRRLLINRLGRVYARDAETGAERELLAIGGELIGQARLSPDGTWLYFLHGSASGDIWTVRFDHDSAAAGK